MAQLAWNVATGFVDGLYNVAITINDAFRRKAKKAGRIRSLLQSETNIPFGELYELTDEFLLQHFEIRFSSHTGEGYYLDSKGGTKEEALEVLENVTGVAVAFVGNGPIGLMAKTPVNSEKVLVEAAKGGIWTATKSRTAVQNAFSHWKKHAAEFPEYLNAKQYAQGAKNFLSNSPKGTLTKVRSNGDILKYHPGSNTFGVMNSSGVPRTMFRPSDGMKYWLKQ